MGKPCNNLTEDSGRIVEHLTFNSVRQLHDKTVNGPQACEMLSLAPEAIRTNSTTNQIAKHKHLVKL